MKTPPRFIEGERAILGGLLLDEDAATSVVAQLEPSDFAFEAHRITYHAIRWLLDQNRPVDLVTLTDALTRAAKLEMVGGVEFLADLLDATPTAANIQHYVDIVKDKALIRRLIAASSEITARGYTDPENARTFLDEAEQMIFAIGETQISAGLQRVNRLVLDALGTVETLYDRKANITGVPSGFRELDALTAGFQPTDLVIVAGRPSMGKTSFALNVSLYAALECRVPTAIFSLEMSKEQLVLRLLCARAHVNLKNVRTGWLSQNDIGRIVQAAGAFDSAPLYIDDSAALNSLEIRARARRLKREQDLGLVIIDYLQLMRGNSGDNREQEIADISRSLKALAKELHVPVMALSQLNRKVEDRTDKRPHLADLRESGAIEQDADVIIFIYRDEVYNKSQENPKRGEAEIILGKQRNGPLGTATLAFKNEWSSFLPLARRDESDYVGAL